MGVIIGVGNGVGVAVGGNHTVVGVMVTAGRGVCVGVVSASVASGVTEQAEIDQRLAAGPLADQRAGQPAPGGGHQRPQPGADRRDAQL